MQVMAMRRSPAADEAVSDRIVGAAEEVHRILGPGLLLSVYSAALRRELGLRQLKFEGPCPLQLDYKGAFLDGQCPLDLLVEESVVVELRAEEPTPRIHEARVRTQMRILGKSTGIILNFFGPIFANGIRRVVA